MEGEYERSDPDRTLSSRVRPRVHCTPGPSKTYANDRQLCSHIDPAGPLTPDRIGNTLPICLLVSAMECLQGTVWGGPLRVSGILQERPHACPSLVIHVHSWQSREATRTWRPRGKQNVHTRSPNRELARKAPCMREISSLLTTVGETDRRGELVGSCSHA